MSAVYFCVVETDSYGNDYPDETFVASINDEGRAAKRVFLTFDKAQIVATAFNAVRRDDRYYTVVDQDYILRGGFEP